MTMLSRAAERVYWTGRYFERMETTARLLQVHTGLYLDLPRSAGLTWAPLLSVTGSAEQFDERYPSATEEHVVEFLATDTLNPGSVLTAVGQARENVRTSRAIFPREVWEGINDLYHLSGERAGDAVPRSTRHGWLALVIDRANALAGMLSATMTHDEAFMFLRIGRHLERADMTSRVLDVRAGTLVDLRRDEELAAELGPFVDIQWMSVLRSLAAYQAYRRKVQSRVQGSAVLGFVLQDADFPRSIVHCLDAVASCLATLKGHDEVSEACARMVRSVEEARVRTLAWEGLDEWVDAFQVDLMDLHGRLDATFFAADPQRPSLLAASA